MFAFLLKKIEGFADRKKVKQIAEVVFSITRIFLSKMPGKKRCPVCGSKLVLIARPVFSEALAKASNFNSEWTAFFNQREGEICVSCGASLRARQLSSALLLWETEEIGVGFADADSMARNDQVKKLKVAEVNSCGALHKALGRLPGLKFSEYESDNPNVPHEDLLNLSYPSGEFDLVLHSDTLEHVPDLRRALDEIHRVLKPGGAMICSVPLVRDGRKTSARAALKPNGELEHFFPPIYHGGSYQKTCQYLVFYDFGDDLFEFIQARGFAMQIFEHEENPAAFTLIARKTVSAAP
jgi:SAM-dependent methyltransferase